MGVLNDVMHDLLITIAEEYPELSQDNLTELNNKTISESLPKMADTILEAISKTSEENLFHSRLELEHFTRRNVFRWRKGFDLMDILREVSIEIGQTINGDFEPGERPGVGCQHRALTRLHAKAMQIFCEIVCLLKNGFADGALARWRALHEVATITCLLGKHDDELAKRFLEFRWIESWHSMKGYQDKAGILELEPFSQEEVEYTRDCYNEMKQRYGWEFAGNYGWAASVVSTRPKSKWVTFADIEKAVGLDHLKPYYRWACQKVHIGCNTLHNSLSQINGHSDETVMLAGPSNAGHADPAHLAAISLNMATTALITISTSIDMLVGCKLNGLLVDKIGQAFIEAHEQLEAEMQASNSCTAKSKEGDG